jgi:hypothetical protein
VKLLNVLHINEFEISALQYPTHYSPVGNGDVLDIVVHKHVQKSSSLTFWTQISYQSFFNLLDHIRTRNLSDPVDKFGLEAV